MARLATSPSRLYRDNVNTTSRAAMQKALEAAPGSIRELAAEAGVSDQLLRMVRDGERRLTPDVRDAVAAALRRWEGRCQEAAEGLEAVDTERRGNE